MENVVYIPITAYGVIIGFLVSVIWTLVIGFYYYSKGVKESVHHNNKS